jgi:hypothetical protein
MLETKSASAKLQEGDIAPVLSVLDQDDRQVLINYSDSNMPTVLYFLSAHCGWCDRNAANVAALVATSSNRYRFYPISRDKDNPAEYVKRLRWPFSVFYRPVDASLLRLGVTPQTIVVSSKGKVVKNWHGAYAGAVQEDVESFFDVRLPGLTMTASSQ